MNHLDDDAELYALGLTGHERAPAIEAHLAQCGPCRIRVVAAEEAAAALAGALAPMPVAAVAPAWPAWVSRSAAAAALVFAATAGVEGFAAHRADGELARTAVALDAMASSHFGHTTLRSSRGVVAKAIYSRDGSWCYIVANGAPHGARVVIQRAGRAFDEGALLSNAPATLFIEHPGKADLVSITNGAAIVAQGVPVYEEGGR